MTDPMWRRIAEDLRGKIESGELGREGRPLPSELELREEYDASRNTVRDAVKWLVNRGLVVTRPGQGTFVVTKIDPFVTTLATGLALPAKESERGSDTASYLSEVMAQKRDPGESPPRVEIQQATGRLAAELKLVDGEMVVSRHQERRLDGTPWSLQTTFYPMQLVTSGAGRLLQAENIPDGAVSYIQQVLGIKQVGWRDRVAVRPPDRREAEFFLLPDDGRIAVIETRRTGYDDSGNPFRVTVTTYPADRNEFVITVGQLPEK